MTALPAITCLCPTYGRFQRLQDAVACFLLQDYAGPKRLLILNDAPIPIILSSALLALRSPRGEAGSTPSTKSTISVVNARPRFATLGHKRQALLEMAETLLVAHWDDDDVYLPWHLSACAARLTAAPSASCAKPLTAYLAYGPPDGWTLQGVRRNAFEGQMVFRRERALALGGYPPLDSGQAAALLSAFRAAGEVHEWEPPAHEISYVYRWADGLGHVSRSSCRSHEAFAARNGDFGLDATGRPQPLTTSRAR